VAIFLLSIFSDYSTHFYLKVAKNGCKITKVLCVNVEGLLQITNCFQLIINVKVSPTVTELSYRKKIILCFSTGRGVPPAQVTLSSL